MTAAMCGIAGGRFIEFNNENAVPSGFERGIGGQGSDDFRLQPGICLLRRTVMRIVVNIRNDK